MERGSLYWVNLEEVQPPEFGKIRPGLVISNTEHNLRLPTVVIVPLSSRKPEIWPLRLSIEMPDKKISFAVLPGIRQVSKTQLQELIFKASSRFLEGFDEALMAYLSD